MVEKKILPFEKKNRNNSHIVRVRQESHNNGTQNECYRILGRDFIFAVDASIQLVLASFER